MFALQIYLLAGLLLHKVIWEALKRTSGEKPVEPESAVLVAIKIVKIGILLGVMLQIWLPDILPISDNPAGLRITGTLIYTIGLISAITARLQLGDNWANIETGQVLGGQKVIAHGIYAYVRHPIYVGDLLLLLGLEIALNSWLALGVLVLAPVVMVKAVKEERMLAEQLLGYEAYCRSSKRFIPFVF